MSAPVNAAVGQPDLKAIGDRMERYVKAIVAVFPDGEDTAAVLAALSSAVFLIITDVGVTPEQFAESMRVKAKKLKKARVR